jgi:hypothetical protein
MLCESNLRMFRMNILTISLSRNVGILTAVYSARNYRDSALCPSSEIVKPIKHNLRNTGSVSVLSCGEQEPCSSGSFRKS